MRRPALAVLVALLGCRGATATLEHATESEPAPQQADTARGATGATAPSSVARPDDRGVDGGVHAAVDAKAPDASLEDAEGPPDPPDPEPADGGPGTVEDGEAPIDAEAPIEDAAPPPLDADAALDAGAPAHCALVGPPPAVSGERLVWSDEFDGDHVDPRRWRVHSGYGGHGSIVNTFTPSAATVHGGMLNVRTEADATDPEHPYTSARLDTVGRFARTYGKLEFRARFPSAPGVWYAVWGRPAATALPELDVEVLGKNAGQAYFVNHWDLPPLPADQRRRYVTAPIDPTKFHTYAIVWRPGSLEWFRDGTRFLTSTTATKGVPTTPVFWTINGWVGGWGATPEPAVPVTFEIDWVRFFRLDGVIAEPVLRATSTRTVFWRHESIELEIANFDEACFRVQVIEDGALVGETYSDAFAGGPYRFPLQYLPAGAHTLTFHATDGARVAETSVTFELR